MIGFELTLPDGTVTQGVIFHDETVFVAEPIADSYASQSDMLDDLSGAKMTILGAIMPLEKCLEYIEEHYTKNIAALERTRRVIQDEYEMYSGYLKKYISEAS